jgi:hypothetical protein
LGLSGHFVDNDHAIARRSLAGDQSIEIKNAAGREVEIKSGSDPTSPSVKASKYRNLVAIEIKVGGLFQHPPPRRGGEEPSKARKQVSRMLTMINVSGLILTWLGENRRAPTVSMTLMRRCGIEESTISPSSSN